MVVGFVLFLVHIWLGGDTLRSHRNRDSRTIRNQTMTPQEKAKELVDKFTVVGLQQRNEGIQCALIAVEVILIINSVDKDEDLSNYWEEVKHEIENYEQH